jgi:hypothetical protein
MATTVFSLMNANNVRLISKLKSSSPSKNLTVERCPNERYPDN